MYNTIYAKISMDGRGPTLVIGNEIYGAADLEAEGFVRSYDRRMKKNRDSEEALPQIMFNASNKTLSQLGIKMNGRYTLDTENKYRDDNEHMVYPLQFQGSTIHAGDKLRMSRPALTIGATREDAEPWFIKEAEIIKFPEPEEKVVQMPNVSSYPDFLTGVKDLHNRKEKGEISQDSHDKLYQDLIHRFMKKESFETPWFLREYQTLDQAKQEIIQQIQSLDISNKDTGKEAADMIDNIYSILNKRNTIGRLQSVVDKALDQEYKDSDLVEITKVIANAPLSFKDKQQFIKNLEADKIINHKLLLQPGDHSLDDLVFGSSINFAVFNHLLSYGRGKQRKGAGEHALAICSKQITVQGAGDINVSGTPVELKVGLTKGSGRFGEEAPTRQEMMAIIDTIPEITQAVQNYLKQGNKVLNVAVFTQLVNNLTLSPQKKREIGTKIFGRLFGNYAKDIVAAFSKLQADPNTVLQQYIKANFDWYKGTKQGGEWQVLVSMNIVKRKFVVITDGQQAIDGTVSLMKNTPYIIPSQPTDALFQANPR
jgi:hypothetical protein